jgi:hypothetical protein
MGDELIVTIGKARPFLERAQLTAAGGLEKRQTCRSQRGKKEYRLSLSRLSLMFSMNGADEFKTLAGVVAREMTHQMTRLFAHKSHDPT